jgi:outer membrane lipoprotein-sorting protein
MLRTNRRLALLALPALLAPAFSGCARHRPTADQVLARMVKAYAQLDTLREEVKARVTTTRSGVTASAGTVDLAINWTFARPNKIRCTIAPVQRIEVVSDGKQLTTVLPETLEAMTAEAPDRVSDLPQVRYAATAAVGLNEFRLLDGLDPADFLTNVRLEPDDARVRGVRCYVLAGELPASTLEQLDAAFGDQRIWVGRDDSLIRRYAVNLRWVTQRHAMEARPDAKADVLERYESLQAVVTQLEPNVAPAPDTFVYTPPEGFHVVANLRRQPLPDITLPDFQGRPVPLSSYRGKDLILVFWASWDLGSVDELWVVQQFRDRHPRKDLIIVAATLDVSTADAKRLLRERNISLPTLQAGGDLAQRVKTLDVVTLPKIVLVDKQGIIRDLIADPIALPDLEAAARAVGFKL